MGMFDRFNEASVKEVNVNVMETNVEDVRNSSTLDAVTSKVMIADENNIIVKVNPAALAMMQEAEADLRMVLPKFSATKLVGSNIDVFHKDPNHQRGLLATLQSTYEGQINIGARTFNLTANPIFDDSHRKLGTVVEWNDVTQQLADDENKQQNFAEDHLDEIEKLEAINKVQAMIEFNLDGTIITANENFLSVVGYSLDDIQGKHHSIFVDPAYKASTDYQQFWAKLNRGEFDVGEYKRIANNGKEVWINASYNPIHDREGNVVKVVKFATDITADKIRNADAEGKLDALDKAQGTIEFNLDGTIITANDNFLSVVGYELSEIKGQHHSMFVEPAYKASAEYQQFWAKLNRGEFDAGEYKRIGKGGKEVWIQASYNPIYDAEGKVYKVVKFASDITEEKTRSADAAGKLSAIDKAQAVIEFNLDGTIITANQNFLSTLGYSLNEIEGQHHSMFVEPTYKVSPEYQQFWEKLNRGEFDGGEYLRIGKGGKEIWIQASYNPIHDAEGKVYKVVKFATDITAAKLQSKLDAANAKLKAALDTASSNVMMADENNIIIYTNDAVKDMLRKAEPDLKNVLPAFNCETVIGSSVDIFHKNPAHQKSMLSALKTEYRTEIEVGGRTFALIANPVFDSEGHREGTVVEWMDRTEELAFETIVDNTIESAVAGQISQRIDLSGREGFTAKVGGGLNDLLDVFEKIMSDIGSSVGELAEGRLTRKIDADYQGSFGTLKNDINATIDKLVEIMSEISESAINVKEGAGEISSGNSNLSQRTEEQAASLEETSAAMEEITTTVQQNAANSVQATTLARGARETAENGGSVVSDAVKAMEAISESSNKINDIIGVIDEIAFQTNLLALNAAVEAARAGDQGRGFAVVADEVRSLAGRSATAAKEIKELIKDSGERVQEGSDLVNKSGETLEDIVTAVKKVNDIVAEISTASDEQATGLDEINKAVGEMDEMTQQNAALVEEAAAASEALGNQAENLEGLISFFDTGSGRVARASASPSSTSAQTQARVAPKPQAAPKPVNDDDGEWAEF